MKNLKLFLILTCISINLYSQKNKEDRFNDNDGKKYGNSNGNFLHDLKDVASFTGSTILGFPAKMSLNDVLGDIQKLIDKSTDHAFDRATSLENKIFYDAGVLMNNTLDKTDFIISKQVTNFNSQLSDRIEQLRKAEESVLSTSIEKVNDNIKVQIAQILNQINDFQELISEMTLFSGEELNFVSQTMQASLSGLRPNINSQWYFFYSKFERAPNSFVVPLSGGRYEVYGYHLEKKYDFDKQKLSIVLSAKKDTQTITYNNIVSAGNKINFTIEDSLLKKWEKGIINIEVKYDGKVIFTSAFLSPAREFKFNITYIYEGLSDKPENISQKFIRKMDSLDANFWNFASQTQPGSGPEKKTGAQWRDFENELEEFEYITDVNFINHTSEHYSNGNKNAEVQFYSSDKKSIKYNLNIDAAGDGIDYVRLVGTIVPTIKKYQNRTSDGNPPDTTHDKAELNIENHFMCHKRDTVNIKTNTKFCSLLFDIATDSSNSEINENHLQYVEFPVTKPFDHFSYAINDLFDLKITYALKLQNLLFDYVIVKKKTFHDMQ